MALRMAKDCLTKNGKHTLVKSKEEQAAYRAWQQQEARERKAQKKARYLHLKQACHVKAMVTRRAHHISMRV